MSFIAHVSRLLSIHRSQLMQFRSYADEMRLIFAAANKVYYNNVEVRQVDVPTFSGAFGILAKHVPTIAVLRPGVVNVVENDGKMQKVFVSSGTVTVNDDSSVQILVEEGHPLENLDVSECKHLFNQYQQKLSSASLEKDKAEAAIGIEVCEALIKAVE